MRMCQLQELLIEVEEDKDSDSSKITCKNKISNQIKTKNNLIKFKKKRKSSRRQMTKLRKIPSKIFSQLTKMN